MGRTSTHIRIPLTISSHNGDEDRRDWEAAVNLRDEIVALIFSTPEYKKIANIGVEGP